ncbi:MAG: prepilin-type N-terminal cleavage/methylation domain-containing protein [Pseudomonas sp.]|uniref:type IV pilus modification PilV family protein n=1 Tax=Pseudomonas sp. TaxID=306 RepID=UPI00339A4B09
MVGRQRGFTILEVLVAFLVAALLLTTIMSAFAGGMSNLFRADRLSVAALVAQSRMAEVGVTGPLRPGVFEGQDAADPNYRWRIDVAPMDWDYATDFAAAGGVLYRVQVSVFWRSVGRDSSFILTSLRSTLAESPP